MITNEDRREVAEEMRQRMREGYNFTSLNIADEIDVNEADYDDPYRFDEDCWKRLADLIEPKPERTCENVATETGILFTCSECHADFINEPIDGMFSYCPNCGAKVVSEDE